MENKVFVGCGIIILNSTRDNVLLAKRKKEPDIHGWQVPGGTIDYAMGENLIDGVNREVFEETGMKIQDLKFLCVINTFYYGKERPIHMIFVSGAESDGIPPNPEPHKASDWQWFALDSLPTDTWFRMSREALKYYTNLKGELLNPGFVVDEEFRNFI